MTHAKSLRQFAADAVTIANAIDVMVASDTVPGSVTPVDPAVTKAAAKRTAEVEGDRKAAARVADDGSAEFAVRMKRLTQEAQADVFDVTEPAPLTPHGATDWACPKHGAKDLTLLTPRKGDPYLMCGVGDCENFQK